MSRLSRGRLTQLRIAAGFATAEEAARALKISRLYQYEIEQGRANPSYKLTLRIARKFNTTEDEVRRLVGHARRDLLRRQLAQLERRPRKSS